MYRTLEAERVRAGWTKQEFARRVGIPYRTLRSKLKGEAKFTIDECIHIKNTLGVEMTVEDLFEKFFTKNVDI